MVALSRSTRQTIASRVTPALLASALSVLLMVLFFPRAPGVLRGPWLRQVVYLVAFLGVTGVIAATMESLRLARTQALARAEELEKLNVELEQQMEEVQTLSEQLQESNEALAAAVASAESVAQARADVLGIVAHDLRNPLHVIWSVGGSLVEMDHLPPAERRMVGIMQRCARQMNRLIDDLLDATRLNAGRLALDVREVDAHALVREAAESLQPLAADCRIELRSHAPEEKCVCRADQQRVVQVIENLVGNALKFAPPGGHVRLMAQHIASEVVFSVSDDGPGIAADEQAHLFDRFWQARSDDRRGVGLGLTITKGIVEAHGGRIWLESTIGVGSTFSFALPAVA